jgi:hypothetical protein
MAVAAAATGIGVAGVIGVVDVILKALDHVRRVIKAAGEVGVQVQRVLGICDQVKGCLGRLPEGTLPNSIIEVEAALRAVAKYADTYKNALTKNERIKRMPKALSRLEKLDGIEKQMSIVLALVTAQVTGGTSIKVEGVAFSLSELENQLAGNTSELTELTSTIVAEFDGLRVGLGFMDEKVSEILLKVDAVADILVQQPAKVADAHSAFSSSQQRTPDEASDLLVQAQESMKSLLDDLKEAVHASATSGGTSQEHQLMNFEKAKLENGEYMQVDEFRNGRVPGAGESRKKEMTFRGAHATGGKFTQGSKYE